MSADISELIEQIRAGLDACTSGPWVADDHIVKAGDIGDAWAVFEKFEDDPPIIYCHEWQQEANAKYIALCSPDRIRRLLDHIAELEARTEWQPAETAPKGEIVNVVGRYKHATAGYPRYAGLNEETGEWTEYSRHEPESIVVWAWRPRDNWPQEPDRPAKDRT